MTQRAVVVFLGRELVDSAAWWGRLLNPGFVHCFVLLQTSIGWIKLETRYGVVKVTQLDEFDDIVSHYSNQGATVVDTTVYAQSALSPFVVRTCVGMVKAMLGIKSFGLTPWQLYKYLTRG